MSLLYLVKFKLQKLTQIQLWIRQNSCHAKLVKIVTTLSIYTYRIMSQTM